MTPTEILQTLRTNEPFKGLPNVRATKVVQLTAGSGKTLLALLTARYNALEASQTNRPERNEVRFDAKFDLQFGDSEVEVYLEAKSSCTPKQVQQIAPWLVRIKALRKDAAFALVCPALSPRSQSVCLEKGIDFIDLAGNFSISVPGKLLIQRTGQKASEKIGASFYRNPFSGKSSRILRVILQNPKAWTLGGITEELARETRRVERQGLEFQVSSGFASRVLRSLEEQVLVVRKPTSFDPDQAVPEDDVEKGAVARGNPIVVPEPKRLLDIWAEKYKERFRWNLRSSVTMPNPFGPDIKSVQTGLRNIFSTPTNVFESVPVDVVAAGEPLPPPLCYAFTSAAATSLTAPFVDADVIDLFIADQRAADTLRTATSAIDKLQAAISGRSVGPDLRVIPPYDAGVFLYAREIDGVSIVSDIQAYLDLYARGGRDLKQADYLFEKRIAPAWARK